MRNGRDFQDVYEVIDAIKECRSVDDVMHLMYRHLDTLGFNYSAYWLRWPVDNKKDPLLITNYPTHYVDHYVAKDFASHDMVGFFSMNTMRPFSWLELKEKHEVSVSQEKIFYDSKSAGLLSGAAIPIHGPGLIKATYSVASEMEEKSFIGEFEAFKYQLYIWAVAAHERILSLGYKEHISVKELTSKEAEVLLWVSRGKTYSEIADRLFVQDDTVKKHMQNIYRKLQAKNGAHATSIALTRGLISP